MSKSVTSLDDLKKKIPAPLLPTTVEAVYLENLSPPIKCGRDFSLSVSFLAMSFFSCLSLVPGIADALD